MPRNTVRTNRTRPNTAPDPPETPVKANEIETIPVEPLLNAEPLSDVATPISFGLLDRELENEREEVEDLREKGVEKFKEEVRENIEALPGYSDAERQKMLDAVDAADSPGDLRRRFDELENDGLFDGRDGALEESIAELPDRWEGWNDLVDDAADGKVTPADKREFFDDHFANGVSFDEDEIATELVEHSARIDLLEDANPGNTFFPLGDDAGIVLTGGLPRGEMVTLGNGTVLVGTGDPAMPTYFGEGSAARLAGMAVGVGEPVPDSEAKPVQSGTVLINAEDATVHYNVNGRQFQMEPGFQQHLPAGKKWTVEFDRGGGHGQGRYGLTEGTYEFTLTSEKGWELFKQKFQVTIDNSGTRKPFHYVIGNRQETAAAGSRNEHSAKYPLVVRFDNGQGQEKKKRLKSGTYRLAISPQGALDLYASTDVAPPVPIRQAVATATAGGRDELFGHRFTPPVARSRATGRTAASNVSDPPQGSLFGD